MLRRLPIVLALTVSCVSAQPLEDGEDDSFGADGKSDGGLSDAEVAGVLAVVNQATEALLRDDVGLSDRVAKNITTHRAGADAKLDTADDDAFGDLAELDAVPYVGKKVLTALVTYAKDHGYVHDGGGGFCANEHAGTTPSGASVKVCDALFDHAPFVHLPADTSSGSSITTFGAIINGIGITLYTADGVSYPLVNSSGQTYSIAHGPTGFKAPENLFAIYSVTGTKTQITGGAAIKVSSLQAVAWIPGVLQDQQMLGTWEARASGRTGTNTFDETKPVTIRFTLSQKTDNTAMWTHFGGGDGFIASGAIDNFDASLTAADGSCLPSLASLGAGSPFYQPTDHRMTLWRHPNMHGLNDQVIVMDYPTGSTDLSMNGMGYIGPFSPIALVTRDPSYASTTIRPHATPNGAKIWGFTKVGSGGAACP